VTTLKRLRDSGKKSLKESLTDTQPGQLGFAKDTTDDYGKYFARRVSVNNFSGCSTNQSWLPNFIAELSNSRSGDCLTFVDNEDYGRDGNERRRLEQQLIDQQVISIEISDSSERNVENFIPVKKLDKCGPVVIVLNSEVVPGGDHESFNVEMAAIMENNDGNMTRSLPRCESRQGFGDE